MIDQYSAPTSIEEATRIMHEGNVTVLAGGTDLMPQTESGKRRFEKTLLNIRRVAGLRDISMQDGRICIGALATMTEILDSDELAKAAPILARAADKFASSQLRNAATIGGNVCNASPAGDMIIPLLLLDAEAVLASWSDQSVSVRKLPIAEFFEGPGTTRKRTNELLTAIEFAVPEPGFVSGFLKSGPRPALEISTVSLGIAGVFKKGALHRVRVAVGAAAPTPLRALAAEAALEGQRINDALINKAAELAAQEAVPIDDVRASAWYRTHLIRVYARRLLQDVADKH